MVAAMKFVVVAVAVICYMQIANSARLPRDTEEAPGLPPNFFENLAKPEFWNALTQNLTSNLSPENLQKLGINPNEIQNNLSSAATSLQKNLGDLAKTLQGLADQQQEVKKNSN